VRAALAAILVFRRSAPLLSSRAASDRDFATDIAAGKRCR